MLHDQIQCILGIFVCDFHMILVYVWEGVRNCVVIVGFVGIFVSFDQMKCVSYKYVYALRVS